jgi:hypothetical protein
MTQGTAGTRGGRIRRFGTAAALLVSLGALAPQVADAAPAGSPAPTVIAAGLDTVITTFIGCDGQEDTQSGVGFLKIDRGLTNTSGTITVDVTYGGTLVPGTDYEALPDPVEIPAGQNATFLEIRASRAGTVTVTVEAGSGYTVGSPAAATSTTTERDFRAGCPDVIEETITVGERPTFVDPSNLSPAGGAIYDANFAIVGDLPTGMSVDGSLISGTATTPGIFEYTFTYCLGPVCALEIPYRTTVVAALVGDPGPPGSEPETGPEAAPAADPISGDATYTG